MTSATLLVPDTAYLGEMPDTDLLHLQSEIAQLRRQVDVASARVAGEVARRSSHQLGSTGLAQRAGLRTPEALVQHVTGATRSEARTLVHVGALLGGSSPWLSAVTSALDAGTLTVVAAGAISGGLGVPTGRVAADDLSDAASALLHRAPGLTPEALAAEARAVRDDLDADGVPDREAARRARRYLRLTALPDGMTRIVGLLDPESAATVVAAIDHITSPRRGGPRFVDSGRALVDPSDGRSSEQVAVDALVDIVAVALGADDGAIFGDRAPAVTLHVTVGELAEARGSARFEGQTASVSIHTAERHICAGGLLPVLFDGNQPIDVGKEHRLFSRRQRRALAARDGDCRFPGCERPPSWTEAHHLVEWSRGGKTEVRNGILLCRHHHLLVHNNGWVIRADDHHGFVIVPPQSVDPKQRPRPMPAKSYARRNYADRERREVRSAPISGRLTPSALTPSALTPSALTPSALSPSPPTSSATAITPSGITSTPLAANVGPPAAAAAASAQVSVTLNVAESIDQVPG